jgi:hypothetical protein
VLKGLRSQESDIMPSEVDTDSSKDREMMGATDEMDALVKDRLDQELGSLVRIADGPDFAAGLEGFLAKSRARFEGR